MEISVGCLWSCWMIDSTEGCDYGLRLFIFCLLLLIINVMYVCMWVHVHARVCVCVCRQCLTNPLFLPKVFCLLPRVRNHPKENEKMRKHIVGLPDGLESC